MLQFNKFFYFIIFISLLWSCQNKNAIIEKDFLSENIDSSYHPGDDFFLFANQGWFKKHPIPDHEQSNGLWQMIKDTLNAQIREICEQSAAEKNPSPGSNQQKIGSFFRSAMDSFQQNKEGWKWLMSQTDEFRNAKSPADLALLLMKIHQESGAPLLGFYVGQDDKNSERNVAFLSQGGLTLPDRNYYLDKDASSIQIRKAYQEYGEKIFKRIGWGNFQHVLTLETELAKISRRKEDTRDPLANYFSYDSYKLKSTVKQIDWDVFFKAGGVQMPQEIIVGQPEFLIGLEKILKKQSKEALHSYLAFHYIHGLASVTDDTLFAWNFELTGKVLRGLKEPKPRWRRAVENTNGTLGELVGQVYVKNYLPKGTKEKLLEIGQAIKEVYKERLTKLPWMTEATRQKALNKLATLVMKVGYPDTWKDLSSLQIKDIVYVQNVVEAGKWQFSDMIKKIGKPVDRQEWHMTPQTYNAYYNPSNNEIVVPGCNILVPGYERKLADDAILYAIIGGSTFGHEITHGFDDQGSKYDEKGNLANWWTPDDSSRFFNLTSKLIHQFNQYTVVDTFHVNGEMTLGENIADLGGIMMGFEAFKKTKQFKENQQVGGLNPQARFFLGYALAWMIHERDESLLQLVRSDVHAPAKFRVIGPLVNMEAFYQTFQINEKHALYVKPNQRVVIW